MKTTTDKGLIRAAQRGSTEAFYQLSRDFDWPVLQLALRVTGTDEAARVIYFETMLRMQAGLAALERDCSPSLCAYRIVVGLCLEYLRRERAQDRVTGAKISLLMSLSPAERVVFELQHYQSLDLNTVGEILEIPEELARNILLRACHKLRTALGNGAGLDQSI